MRLMRERSMRMMAAPRATTRHNEASIGWVACAIILLFVVCHVPKRIEEGIQIHYKRQYWHYACFVTAITNFLVVLNSSVNFLIYFFIRRPFRNILYNMVCLRAQRDRSESLISSASTELR